MCFEKGTLGWVFIPLLNKLKGESITLVKERKKKKKKGALLLITNPSIQPRTLNKVKLNHHITPTASCRKT